MKTISKISFFSIVLYILITFICNSLFSTIIPSAPKLIQLIINDFLGPLSILSFFLFVLLCYLWNVPGLSKIIKGIFDTNPCIRGTWKGTLIYEWNNKTETKTVFLSIFQKDAFSVSCNLYTDKRKSLSKTANIIKSDNETSLVYTYDAKKATTSPDSNPQHDGVTILTLDSTNKTLIGEYFTNHNTAGHLELSFLSPKTTSSFKEAICLSQNLLKNKK